MKYFDLHCDTASACAEKGIGFNDNSLAVSANKGKIFTEWYQCFAVFINDTSIDPKTEYRKQISGIKYKIKDYGINPIFTLENALPIDSIDFINELVRDSISAVTLTWNGENMLAGGVDTDAGLKNFGRCVIHKLNEHNIAVDLSHLNRKSFYEVLGEAEIIFASHSCCDKTHHHKRNLTDEQLKLIADREGIIGVCFYPEFLGTKYAFEGVWRHIYHMLNIGLENNIAIGSDFDGATMSAELDGVDKIPELYRFLISKGIGNDILNKVFFENAKKFFKKL